MAQSVEQLIRNQQVTGSNPVSSSKKNSTSFDLSNFFIQAAGLVWNHALACMVSP